MKFVQLPQPDVSRLLNLMEMVIDTPSVVGYYPEIDEVIANYAAKTGYEVSVDNRHTLYVTIPGQSHERTVCVGAHLDTIGMVVRAVEDNGWLDVRNLGGVNFHSLEGENVYVHTRKNGTYSGMVICKSHSVHVFDDARERERDFAEMAILLDEDVASKQEVLELGIQPGDLVSVEPRFTVTETGYIKSRHIDDKASVAILLEIMALLKEQNLTPQFDTMFAFPINEEIGLGGKFVPDSVDEYLALDIGLVGGLQNGSEKKVSISGADRIAPYDWDHTTMLMDMAQAHEIDYAMDIYYRYASDATAAFQASNNITPLSIGMGTLNSHGYERTHIDGVVNTCLLTLAYLLDERDPEE